MDYMIEKGFGWDALEPDEQIRIIESCLEDPGYHNTILKNISNSDIDFDASKYDQIITDEITKYKKESLRNSKALYFDMAGTICDIPITSENWESINIDGINKVMEYLGYNEVLSSEESRELINHFIDSKKNLRKRAKTTLEESAISDQLTNFMQYAEKQYPAVAEKRALKGLTESDIQAMDKLFVSPELDITIPFEGVVESLEKLAEKYDLYLLSNNVSRQLVIDIVEKIGCTHCFKDIFVSEDCGYRKPHINFIDYVTLKTKLKPENCVMIGDRLTQDIRMANLHNLKSIYAAMVDHEDNGEAHHEYYDYIIHDFKELEDIFL